MSWAATSEELIELRYESLFLEKCGNVCCALAFLERSTSRRVLPCGNHR